MSRAELSVFIRALGVHAPDRKLTNTELSAMVATSDEWIKTRSGISERRIAGAGENPSDMGAQAAAKALARAGLKPTDIDLVIVATMTPDVPFPSTACLLQAKLGLRRDIPCFDISAACSGWLYAAIMGESLIASGSADTVLVIGAEMLSTIVDWTDRNTCILFADGAGATVLRRNKERGGTKGVLSSFMRSDGALAELLWRPAGGAAEPFSPEVFEQKRHCVRMAGREVFKHAVRSMAEATDRALDSARLTAADVDLLIPHQANVRIIEATAKHAGISMEKVFINVDRFGNTSAASIPIALSDAVEQGRVKEGTTVMFVAFGAGFTWGSLVARF